MSPHRGEAVNPARRPQVPHDDPIDHPKLELVANRIISPEHTAAVDRLRNLEQALASQSKQLEASRQAARGVVERIKRWAAGIHEQEAQLQADRELVDSLKLQLADANVRQLHAEVLPQLVLLESRVQSQSEPDTTNDVNSPAMQPAEKVFFGERSDWSEFMLPGEMPEYGPELPNVEQTESEHVKLVMRGERSSKELGKNLSEYYRDPSTGEMKYVIFKPHMFGEDYGLMDAEHNTMVAADGNSFLKNSAEAAARVSQQLLKFLNSLSVSTEKRMIDDLAHALPYLPDCLADMVGDGGAVVAAAKYFPELGKVMLVSLGDIEPYHQHGETIIPLFDAVKKTDLKVEQAVTRLYNHSGLAQPSLPILRNSIRFISVEPGDKIYLTSDGVRANSKGDVNVAIDTLRQLDAGGTLPGAELDDEIVMEMSIR